jgi:hypothetical protein
MEKIKIRLDIDLISEELYKLIIAEFKSQHPYLHDSINLVEWKITAEVEQLDLSENLINLL